MNDIPVVCYNHSGKNHYVNASGGPEDGSLHLMYTYCGQQIDLEALPDGWTEVADDVTCNTCIRSERAGRPYREHRALRNACAMLLYDAACRPGAYIYARLDKIRILMENQS